MEDKEPNIELQQAAFTRKLYNAVSLRNPNDSIIFSPFSIAACLGMARIGAQGKTADEIDQGLEWGKINETTIAKMFSTHLKKFEDLPFINFATRIYVMSGHKVLRTFNDIVSKHFCSEAKEVDFKQNVATAKSINDWVEMRTNQRIQNLVSSDALNANTGLILINAIHFKSKWSNVFDKEKTKDDKFYLNENDFATVPMMNMNLRTSYGDILELDATALELRYEHGMGVMLIVLPNSRTGLKTLEEKLKDISIYDIEAAMADSMVTVKLPKFKVEFSVELTEPLRELGITTMFTDEADFSKMLEIPKSANVSAIIHKAFIEVDEEGTEAAAATEVFFEFRSLTRALKKKEIEEFIVDRPFYYCIHTLDGVILYAGSVQRI